MRFLRRILSIPVLERAGLSTMFMLLRQSRLQWLGHVRRMEDSHIPKDILKDELACGRRTVGRPQLRFKDVCKRDMKTLDRSRLRSVLRKQLKSGEEKILTTANEKRARRKASIPGFIPTCHTCSQCDRDRDSRIGLISHNRRCR